MFKQPKPRHLITSSTLALARQIETEQERDRRLTDERMAALGRVDGSLRLRAWVASRRVQVVASV